MRRQFSLFGEKSTCNCSRCYQRPWTDQITEISPYVRKFFWVAILFKHHGWDVSAWQKTGAHHGLFNRWLIDLSSRTDVILSFSKFFLYIWLLDDICLYIDQRVSVMISQKLTVWFLQYVKVNEQTILSTNHGRQKD